MPVRSFASFVVPTCALAGTLTACGGGRAPASEAPTPADAPVAASAPAAVPSTGSTRFSWSAGARRYEVRTEAVVTRDGPAGGTPVGGGDDRVVSTAYVTAEWAPGTVAGAASVRGAVDSLVVDASPRVRGDTAAAAGASPAPRALLSGFRYRAASDARGVRVEADDPGTDLRCTAAAGAASLGALAAVREALPRVPADLAAGARWRDTTVSASCAGPVLLVVQTVARYESAADPAVPGRLRVTRQTTTTARGQGTAGVRPVAVIASGTGRAVYALDPARGVLVDGTGEGRATLTVTVAGVAQRLLQQTRTQIVAR